MIKRLLTVLIVAFSLTTTAQNCFEIESFLADACDTPEGFNEMVRIRVAANALNTANLSVSWPTPGYTWHGGCQSTRTSSRVALLNASIQKCGWILEPVGGVLPANSTVIIVTSDSLTPSPGLFANLEDTIYMVFQCAWTGQGHFTNYGASVVRTLIMSFSGANGCSDTVSYNRANMVNINGGIGGSTSSLNGSSVAFTPSGTATYYNNGCQAPIPISKLSIDTAIDAVGSMVIPANNNITICPYQDSIQLVGKSVNNSPKFFKWTGGSGTFTQPDSVKTTYLFSGSEIFPLSLYLKSYGKCAGDTIRDTIVLNLYVPNLSTIPDTFVCSGGSVTLATAGSGFSGHTWSPAAGLSCTGCAAPVASPSSATTYCVIATNGNGCKDTACVLVDTIAYPTITVSNDTTICNGQTVNLSITSTSTINNWSSNETVSTLSCTACTNPSVMPTSTATFAVASGDKCISRDTVNITVNPVITADVSLAVSQNPICAGTNVTFTATPTNGGATPVYAWYLNGIIQANIGATYSGNAFTNNDKIKVIMASSAAPCLANPLDTSNEITLTVNPNLDADVTIASSATTICAGSSVTFTATPTNGGAAPVYQWQVNGVNAGTNSSTFSTTTLNNNDIVTVILTSNATPCLVKAVDTSNAMTMTVNPNLAADVTITASASTICAGSSVTFTATPVNGGTAPIYQWQVNGVNAGTNSNTFSSSALNNNDQVTVILTSNASPCLVKAMDTSNTVVITVANNLQADVTIVANTTTICPGTNVTFTATPTNGGATPTYQWQVNGVNAGTNSATFSSTTLNNNDVVSVIMTSSATSCVTKAIDTSNLITITVNPNIDASVTIAASATTICAGNNVTFTATPTNGGAAPVYQWQVNGVNAGTNSNTFSTTTLNNNDIVTVILTSNATPCLVKAVDTSNAVTMTVNPNLAADVTITASATTICAGSSVTFTATPVNGGTAPIYQWQINGVNAGTNSSTFTTSTLNNNDQVTVILTSNASPCLVKAMDTSNVITMTVNANTPVSVSIAASATTICAGTNVTFTATPTNGGATPTFQWQVNGVNTGTNSATFSSTTLNNNDVVTVIMTSSLTNCLSNNPATSNAITMTVSSTASPTISITADNNPVCAGSSVTFTATITNGGSSPIYQWKLNGTNVGSNSNTYSIASPNNGDVVVCSITNNDACVATPTATASPITITVTPTVTPTISIAANPTAICENTPVTFTATITNGGSQPVYTWFKNSIAVGTNSTTYTDNTLTSADIITCQLTSNAACANPLTVTSNPLSVQVNPYPIADAGADATIDKGESITLNGSGGDTYTWTANSIVVGNTANITVSPAQTTAYVLEVTNTFGCKDLDTVNINVVYPNVSIYLPTAFSPNNDSKNDEYLIKSNQDFKFFDIKIYNRWGELVFSSNNLYDGWDGKFKGDSQPVGVYVVMVKAVPYSAPEQNFIQSVTLIK